MSTASAESIAPQWQFSFRNISNNKPADTATGNAQLTMTVSRVQTANQVMFTFLNSGPNPSSITNIYFDDGRQFGDTGSLEGIAAIINTPGVAFSDQGKETPPDLASGNSISPKFTVTKNFSADSDSPVQPNGVNPGEQVSVVFNIQSGKTFANVIAELQNAIGPTYVSSGAFTAPNLRVGIHVQGFVGGGSEQFINGPGTPLGTPVPLPGVALSGALLMGLTGRCRFRSKLA